MDSVTISRCPTCDKPFPPKHKRKYCNQACYIIALKGHPPTYTARIPIEERFWKRVDKKSLDECWEWTGKQDKFGYGRIKCGKRHGRHISAHRLSYEIANGPIPTGLLICHRCNNPRCVNPRHLYAGTHRDNSRDRSLKINGKAVKPPSHLRWPIAVEIVVFRLRL